jgi:hypothetical protein
VVDQIGEGRGVPVRFRGCRSNRGAQIREHGVNVQPAGLTVSKS